MWDSQHISGTDTCRAFSPRGIAPGRKRDPHWYAVTVKPQHEKAVAQALTNKGFDPFVPMHLSRRRWSDRIKELELPLFPGYVFCHFVFQNRVPVVSTPGVNSIVAFGSEPAPVPDEEIAAIRTMLQSGWSVQPWPFLKVGQCVRIKHGPLEGLEGYLLREKDCWRVVVNVEILQRSVAVEIDRESLAAAAAFGAPRSSAAY